MLLPALRMPSATSAKRTHRLNVALVFALTLGFILLLGQPGHAQFSLSDDFAQQEHLNPPNGVTRHGNIETIVVDSPLSSRKLFEIAAPTVYDRTPDAVGDRQTVERRAAEVQAKLLILLNRPMDPETLKFEVSRLNNVAVIDVKDAQYTRPLVLLSVTDFDADFNGQPIDQLAADWRDTLERELREGLRKLPENRQRVTHILVGLLIVTASVIGLKYAISKRQKQLRRQKKKIRAAAIDPDAESALPAISESSAEASPSQKRTALVQRLQTLFSLDHQLSTLDFLQWLLFWLMILTWYGSFVWVALISPYVIRNQFYFLDSLLTLLLIWFFTGLAIRLSRRLIDHLVTRWADLHLLDFMDLGDAQRRQLRTSTISSAIKGVSTIAIALVGVTSMLGTLGLPTASVVAIGSLAGLAITFGSQNLVKDLVNGFFILAEDQYAIGDVIDLGHASGLVENLNMRVTQIRSSGGELITIPNSSIAQVKNLTRTWSRVNFSIDVDYRTDPDRALAILREVTQGLYHDPAWHDKLVAEPQVLGLDSVSHNGLTFTTWIQTKPAEQWSVGRELRLRVRRALSDNGIEIGSPRQTLMVSSNADDNGDPVSGETERQE